MSETAVIAESLKSALARIGNSIDNAAKLPVLTCVRLHAAAGAKRLTIEATDLITWQRVSIPCMAALGNFDAVVPHKILKEYVAFSKPFDRLDLRTGQSELHIIDISDRARFKGFDSAEFPKVPTLDDIWQRVATWQATRPWRGQPATGDVAGLKVEAEALERYAIPDSDKRFNDDSFARFLRLTFTPSALHLRAARPDAVAERVLTAYPAEKWLTVDVPRLAFADALAAHKGESDCIEVLSKVQDDGTLTLCLKSDVREVFIHGQQPKGGEMVTPELLWRGEVEKRSLLSLVSKVTKKDTLQWTFAAQEITLERGDQEVSAPVHWSKTAEVEFVGRAVYALTEERLTLAARAIQAHKKAPCVHVGLAVYDWRLPMLAVFSENGVDYIALDEHISDVRKQSEARAQEWHQHRRAEVQLATAQAAFDALPVEARSTIVDYREGRLSWQGWWKQPEEWRGAEKALRDAQQRLDELLGRRPFSA